MALSLPEILMLRVVAKSSHSDHLPPHIETTLDQKLHRAAPIMKAVDSILSTNHYRTDAFDVIDSVSDHMALFAEVSKNVR